MRRGFVLAGVIAFLAQASGCMSARFTRYRHSFDCRPPEYPPGVICSSAGECTFMGPFEYAGAQYDRYDLSDSYGWKRELSSMSYLIPKDVHARRAFVLPGLRPPFQTNQNCRFIFVPEGVQLDLQQVLKNYDREWKYFQHWHPLIIMVEATASGKGTRVKLLERTELKDGVSWGTSRECEVEDVLHRNPWWVATLPAAYIVTVPLDVVTFPIQAPFLYIGYRISRTMSPR